MASDRKITIHFMSWLLAPAIGAAIAAIWSQSTGTDHSLLINTSAGALTGLGYTASAKIISKILSPLTRGTSSDFKEEFSKSGLALSDKKNINVKAQSPLGKSIRSFVKGTVLSLTLQFGYTAAYAYYSPSIFNEVKKEVVTAIIPQPLP